MSRNVCRTSLPAHSKEMLTEFVKKTGWTESQAIRWCIAFGVAAVESCQQNAGQFTKLDEVLQKTIAFAVASIDMTEARKPKKQEVKK